MTEIVDIERFGWILGGMNWDKLSDAQMKLIESFERYVKKNGALTERQSEVLESIYKERSMECGSWVPSDIRREKRNEKRKR